MTIYSGSCLCGTVRFEVKGEFDSFYLCYCRRCQKDTGSAHGANLFSQSARLSWTSGVNAVASFTLPGTRHSKCFCKHCGSALPNTQVAGLLVVPAGSLDTEVSLLPAARIFTCRQMNWSKKSDGVPVFKKMPV
ncbi:GFA family protein [Oceanimonas marisflavi]|uniref:GFA family protein n=1 Tax=Oceanimonas marisflavi TaxID=2059724 RepID=UPI000D2F6F42|nr:GFA family protein [Oceanimonas marisflavi]